MSAIVCTGAVRPLEQDDVVPLPDRFCTHSTGHATFDPLWRQELTAAKPSLMRALFRAFGARLVVGGVLKVVNDICIFVAPVLLRLIIQHLQERNHGRDVPLRGVVLALALFLTYSCQSIVFHQYLNLVSVVGVQLRGALVTAVFDKSCRLSPESRVMYKSGQIQNLMSTDSRTISEFMLYIHMLWSALEQVLIAMLLLVNLVGPLPTFAGIIFIVISVPLQGVLMAAIKSLRGKASHHTDERVKNIAEAIKSIKLVKLYAWELSLIKRILNVRAKELEYLRKMAITEAWSTTIVTSMPTMLTVVVITVFALTGRSLNAAVVFPAIALFSVIRPPLLFLPGTIINTARATASLSRLQAFFSAEEMPPHREGPHAIDQAKMRAARIDMAAENASFEWDPSNSSKASTLAGVSLEIPEGSLIAVVGPTGAGKTSLLVGLLGELPVTAGKVGIRSDRSVAYGDQMPFLQNATIRDNILFGKTFDEEHYWRTATACSLLPDFEQFPGGDLTEIGSRGVNLSGGQRARICLARAAYSRSDICLLDGPLCAVDSHVGMSIFRECIVSMLRGKTRVFTTNHIHFASSPEVDMVAVVGHGTVLEFGKRIDLLADPDSEFTRLVDAAGEVGTEPTPGVELEDVKKVANISKRCTPDRSHSSIVVGSPTSISSLSAKPEKIVVVRSEPDPLHKPNAIAGYGAIEAGKLTAKETKEKGRVEVKHYFSYFKAMGALQWVLPIFLFALCTQICTLGVNLWLSIWSEESTAAERHDHSAFNLFVLCLLGLFAVAVCFGSAFSLAFGIIRASVVIHERLLFSVFGAPSSFFNANPDGRLVNRFNSDMDKIDCTLGPTLQSLLRLLLSLAFTLGLILWATPAFIFFVIPVAAVCLYAQDFYRKCSVDLRRLEALACSPLYSHFGETLDGLITVRAYGGIPLAAHKSALYADTLNKITYASCSANRWVAVRLESLGTLLILGATVLALFAPPGQVSASVTGLVLSYVMQILGVMTWSVREFTETESQMSAIERVAEYSQPPFPQEEAGGIEAFLEEKGRASGTVESRGTRGLISDERKGQLQSSMRKRRSRWPRKGHVEFEKVEMRYRKELAPTLRSVSFVVGPGEHVGIVGRTGAGKSSAIQCLFRLHELQRGRILIDGVDITELRLFDLRSSLGIIPQEPVCFSGTVRSNLDMFGEHDDHRVLEALRACGLQETMAEEVGLEYEIEEGGWNLSVGQRQLLCLGRALLQDSQILVLDEATSSVSQHADAQIQRTIREEMGHCTVLKVAHRLHTVMQCDRIIVMDKGRVVEEGRPWELLERKSLLADMVNETGASTAAHLKYLAGAGRWEKNYAKKEKLEAARGVLKGDSDRGRIEEMQAMETEKYATLLRRARVVWGEMRKVLAEARSAGMDVVVSEGNAEGREWKEIAAMMAGPVLGVGENLGEEGGRRGIGGVGSWRIDRQK